MAHPDVPAKVIETMRAYFRRFIAAGGSQFLEDWFDVERELTLGDARISARDKEQWLSVVDQMEQEFLPGHRADEAPAPKGVNTGHAAREHEYRHLGGFSTHFDGGGS